MSCQPRSHEETKRRAITESKGVTVVLRASTRQEGTFRNDSCSVVTNIRALIVPTHLNNHPMSELFENPHGLIAS